MRYGAPEGAVSEHSLNVPFGPATLGSFILTHRLSPTFANTKVNPQSGFALGYTVTSPQSVIRNPQSAIRNHILGWAGGIFNL